MPLNIRTYHDLTEPDASGLLGQVVAQRGRVAARLADVRRVVAVMSGKGGVGKSFVTAHLARACSRAGLAVGVLDADLNGPTAARLLEAPRIPLTVREDSVVPAVAPTGAPDLDGPASRGGGGRSRSAAPRRRLSSGAELRRSPRCASFCRTWPGGSLTCSSSTFHQGSGDSRTS